jgi:hypothetical protein
MRGFSAFIRAGDFGQILFTNVGNEKGGQRAAFDLRLWLKSLSFPLHR